MASQKMIFLAILVLIIAHGHHVDAKACNTNKECPPCKIGQALCSEGKCTCLDFAIDAKACKTNKECPPCEIGQALCSEGKCTCLDFANENKSGGCKSTRDCSKTCCDCVAGVCLCNC